MKKVLVIGGSGFVGGHLVQYLNNLAIPCTATYRKHLPQIQLPHVTWLQLDILDIDALSETIAGFEFVYHCANAVSFDASDADDLMHNNVEGTANVVNACLEAGVQKLLFVSSVAACGRGLPNTLITEKSPWQSNAQHSVYAISKYRAEMEVWRGLAEGLNTVIVNPAVILGEGDWHSSSAQLYKHAFSEFAYYTLGKNAFVDVQDVVKAMHQLMHSDIVGERFILSAGNFYYKDIIEKIARAMKRKPATKVAKPWMTNILWRLFALRKLFTGKKSLITKETAHTAQAVYEYDNTKLLSFLPSFTYQNIDDTIKRSSGWYLREK